MSPAKIAEPIEMSWAVDSRVGSTSRNHVLDNGTYEHHLENTINPYVAIGGYFTPRCTFYPVALKPLGIVTKAFVTFPEYMWAKKC